MAKLQKVTFEAREENLHFFCPLCGTHSCDESGEITPCSHLVLVVARQLPWPTGDNYRGRSCNG